MTILDEIANERQRQIAKGYDAKHDDEHNDCSIAHAAAQYAADRVLFYRVYAHKYEFDRLWPWEDWTFPSPKLDDRQRLVIAAALCIAEIERIDRRAQREASMHLTNDCA